ncbi:YciI family protein [Dongia soli]|uniref:YciI family protein n=1 Tax=Dongia soli TaxID=600628 RepID=A0ABU5EF35_9PROT|nr:YciI family protein [Dongia soli]MDY0884787.1 YciI family protein [Dongia soli]
MRYLCLIHWDEEQAFARPKEELAGFFAAHRDFNEKLTEKGQYVVSLPLQKAASAAIVRLRNGRIDVTDGPFIETEEQIAGFYLIEAATLDEAIEIASHIPVAAHGTIEIRPCRDCAPAG